jgi:monoamine oxidase
MTDVIILGAGAAGLSAARQLSDHNVDFVVLEARERIGGRVFTHRDRGSPLPIELGAEFIHGAAPEIEQVLDAGGILSCDVDGPHRSVSAGRVRRADQSWGDVESVLRRLDPNRTPDRSFQAFLDSRPGGRRLAGGRRAAAGFVEGFHAADPRLIGERALARSQSSGDPLSNRQGRVLDGYDRVMEWLAEPLVDRIRHSAVVHRVRWAPGNVSAEVRHPDGRPRPSVDARAAIVTLPASVLKAPPEEPGAVEFVPELRAKRDALRHVIMGSAVRITLRFSEAFWRTDWFARHIRSTEFGTLAFLHTGDEHFPIWWTAHPVREPVMVAWCGGPRARELARLAYEEIEALAVAGLATQLGIPARRMRALVEGGWMHDWEHDPFSRGAYSYAGVGGADASSELAKPLRGTLFFAGEAIAPGADSATVHGAMATGRRAAAAVMRGLRLADS